MPEITADYARHLMKASTESHQRLVKAIKAVENKIKDKASQGHRSIMYPFDNLIITDADRRELVNVFQARGFEYAEYDDPDPGHPCSRPYSELSW